MEPQLADPTDSSKTDTLLIIIRAISIILLFGISILLGILPIKLTALNSNPKLIAYVNSFSAGLFLGLGMMHLLAESLSDFDQYLLTSPSEEPFPVPFGVAVASFTLILFTERIIFQAHNFLHLHADVDSKESSNQASEQGDVHEALIVAQEVQMLECNQEKEEEIFKNLISSKQKVAKVAIDKEFHRAISESAHHHDKIEHGAPGHNSVAGPYAILIALSIHGIFEGAAIGIQKNPSRAFNLMVAVVLHKWAEALTLGVALFRGKIAYKVIILQICLFSASAPLGIAVGWMLSNASLLVSCIFKALSAGTFLYIAATELIVEEFSISTNMYSKFLMYLGGIVFMGLIAGFE